MSRGLSKRTGERYIVMKDTLYRVQVPTGKQKIKQYNLGYYKTLEDAINVRDKYLNENNI